MAGGDQREGSTKRGKGGCAGRTQVGQGSKVETGGTGRTCADARERISEERPEGEQEEEVS